MPNYLVHIPFEAYAQPLRNRSGHIEKSFAPDDKSINDGPVPRDVVSW